MYRRLAALGFAAVTAMAFGTSPVSAGLLENRDPVKHDLYLQSGSGGVTAKIRAGQVLRLRCAELPCRVTVVQSHQRVEIRSNDEDLFIWSGRIYLRKPSSAASE